MTRNTWVSKRRKKYTGPHGDKYEKPDHPSHRQRVLLRLRRQDKSSSESKDK